MLELGKLTALEKYYLDVIAPFVAELDLNAEVVSASPSRTVADATEVTVEMTLTYAPEKPVLGPHNAISSLRQIVNGDFWLPHQRTTMEALNLPAYDQWVEDTLFNMPLLAVVSVGNHQAYYPAFGNRDALQPENSRKPWGYTLKHLSLIHI